MRPKIICHMVSSIDGRLLVDRWTPPPSGVDSNIIHNTYDRVAARFEADGWIVGRESMEGYAKGTTRTLDIIPVDIRSTHLADRK
jgi:5-amino-6-(5-phosphoribosylamino)uracil reductase